MNDKPNDTLITLFPTLIMKCSDFLSKSEIAVIPSRWEEPFGRTALEASSRGCATIISNTGGLSETTDYAIKLNVLNVSNIENEVIKKSFNEYINGLRLLEFKNISLKQENQKLSILGLAYECGFNSKSVFNDFFKKTEGITPSQWIKNQN